LFGVGIGSYGKIGKIYLGSASIAHNTYLQLLVEWGTVMTTIFFGFIASLIIKTRKSDFGKYLLFLLIPLLLGSLSISLNNARIFWILLGMLLYIFNNRKKENFNSKLDC